MGELGGLILTNFEVHDFPTSQDHFDGFYYGQDFGFNHADALLGIGWKDGEIYVTSEIYVFEKDTEEIIAMARNAHIAPRVEMFCDSAEPDRIKMCRRPVSAARPVKKEPGSVKGPDRLPEGPEDPHPPVLREHTEGNPAMEMEKGCHDRPVCRRTS